MIEFYKQYLNNAIVMDECQAAADDGIDEVTLPSIDGIDWATQDPNKIYKNVEAVLNHRTPEEEAAFIEYQHCMYFNLKLHGLYKQGFFKTDSGERLKVLAALIHKAINEPEIKIITPTAAVTKGNKLITTPFEQTDGKNIVIVR